MAEGDKFEGYTQISEIKLNSVGVIIDKDDPTHSPEGTTKYFTWDQVVAFINKYANSSVENVYEDIADLLANQGEQGAGNLQRVIDASADPTVNTGQAFYEYLGTTNVDLTDYVKLTSEQIQAMFNAVDWKIKEVRSKEIDANTDATNAVNGNVLFVTDTVNITHIIFDRAFTSALQKSRALSDTYLFSINIYNADKETNLKADITSFTMVDGNSKIKMGVVGIADNDLAEGEKLYFDLPTERPTEVYIDGLWFDTRGNANPRAIAAGNVFRGEPTANRYVIGKVLDPTDFDIDDNTKATLYLDNLL